MKTSRQCAVPMSSSFPWTFKICFEMEPDEKFWLQNGHLGVSWTEPMWLFKPIAVGNSVSQISQIVDSKAIEIGIIWFHNTQLLSNLSKGPG